ncbi:hypothetical protein ACW9UR_01600 [Halovulum sp. GXIMD14794]
MSRTIFAAALLLSACGIKGDPAPVPGGTEPPAREPGFDVAISGTADLGVTYERRSD